MLHEEPTATYSLLSGPTTTVRVECPGPLGSVASFSGVAAPGLKRSSASVSPTYIVSPRNARPNGWCRPSATVITVSATPSWFASGRRRIVPAEIRDA